MERMNKDFSALKQKLYIDDGKLKSPAQTKAEFEEAKNMMRQYQDFKEKHNFVNKRAKVLNGGWKHGILGVEIPDDLGSNMFKERQSRVNYEQDQKNRINDYRLRKFVKAHEVSSQIDFARTGVHNTTRKDQKIIDIQPEWKTK
mmetsp:Transcript_5068/g.4631  ORF Transcript_5068/g.4631 Transcript_5068/m.4631 type:complete len:144 (+) Transcript_5068:359-790(+)